MAHSTLVKALRNFLGSVLFSGASSSSHISGAGWAASHLFCPPSPLAGCLLDKALSNSPCTALAGAKCVQRPQDGASGQPALSYPSCGDRCLFLEFHFKATSQLEVARWKGISREQLSSNYLKPGSLSLLCISM